jgi:hypothetical protein
MARLLKKSWHDALLECVSKHTEAPDRFIHWAAFSVIGAAMKNKFFYQEGIFTIYPNQYIVLVAPPGIGKVTAVNFKWNLIRQTQPNPIVNMISDRVTAPKILDRIADGWNHTFIVTGQQVAQGAKDHTCTIFSTELSILIGASDMMLDFLCEGWDRNEYDYDTKHSGSAFIKNMCTSLIACTVPDFIRNIDRNRDLTIKGGFTSRCLFIFEDKIARQLPFPPPLQSNRTSMDLLDALKNDLQEVAQLPGGEFKCDVAARIVFENFINSIRLSASDDLEAMAHFKSRIKAHILKLAMVISISRHDTLVIQKIDMDNAIAAINTCLKTLEKVFRGSGDSDMASATAHVQNYMEKTGAASRKELLSALHRHMDFAVLDRILYVLTEIGYCEPITIGNSAGYRVVTGLNKNHQNGTARAASAAATRAVVGGKVGP